MQGCWHCGKHFLLNSFHYVIDLSIQRRRYQIDATATVHLPYLGVLLIFDLDGPIAMVQSAKDPAIPAILGPSIACINRIEMGNAQASVFSVFPLLLSQITTCDFRILPLGDHFPELHPSCCSNCSPFLSIADVFQYVQNIYYPPTLPTAGGSRQRRGDNKWNKKLETKKKKQEARQRSRRMAKTRKKKASSKGKHDSEASCKGKQGQDTEETKYGRRKQAAAAPAFWRPEASKMLVPLQLALQSNVGH